MVVDENALLQQFAAQFAHDPGDLDDTSVDDDAVTFNVDDFLKGLDDIFDRHAAAKEAGPYLEQAMTDAENAGDDAGLLTVLNETMGFYRSQGKHKENQWIVQRAIELAARMGLTRGASEAWATTLINCATAMRAAHQYDQAEDLYHQAQDVCARAFSPTDRRLAALHNNLSMVYSETNRPQQAQAELREALRIVEASSVNPDADIDVASSHTNLALALLADNKLDEAHEHAARALEIYRTGHLEHSAHFASALAGFAQVCFAEQRYADAVDGYRRALAVIEECYGKNTDYWRITADNLQQAEAALHAAGDTVSAASKAESDANQSKSSTDSDTDAHTGANVASSANVTNSANAVSADASPAATATPAASAIRSGMQLARAYWEAYGKPMIAERYPEYQGRIAAGLVGHGSECYGFDDEISRDHDFGPRFCLWLTDEDYAAIGERLQADYEALPPTFMGFGPRTSTPRAQGASRRDGVFAIGDFFESITGYRQAPDANTPHEWLTLNEATLAAATNGEVFADPLGVFLAARQGFKTMPDDVRLALISQRIGMMAQAGQYNVPRMLKRGDSAAAWLSINEFVQATASLVFLINNPVTVGYLPYYKWQFAALRRLSGRISTRLAGVCEQLETLLRLSSAACYGGAGFGEGGKGSAPAIAQVSSTIDDICSAVVAELQREGLTRSSETFLEWQRPYVEEHIRSTAACLHSL